MSVVTEVTQAERSTTTPSLQPLLHDLASAVAAPGLLLSSADGQVRPGGVSGWYVGDLRLLDTLELVVEGSDLDVVRAAGVGAARQEYSYLARSLGDRTPDPTVRLDRVRTLEADGFTEVIVAESVAAEPVELVIHLVVGADLAPMAEVKQGLRRAGVPGRAVDGGVAWEGGATVTADPAPEVAMGRLTWRLRLTRGERRELTVRAHTDVQGLFAPGRPVRWKVEAEADDRRVSRTVDQGLADLAGLLLSDDGDRFLAAGSPWFLTLFGRDSLWAARMLVPFDSALALSTLRVLARRQGTRDDPMTEEQPGKILHEVRGGQLDLGAQVLPPLYYGTVDATPLFVATLADAHDWGADPEQVRALLPAARAALAWLTEQSAATGWIRYVDQSGHGLSNQGWKDSHDSVQFADGRLAEPPIALSEVQAYAYEAAVRGGALLAAYGEEPVPGLAEWAEDLRSRFRREFWVETAEGGHVAIALDGAGRRVDSVASNMGHLLGTGILAPEAVERVAQVLADPRMDSGFGLRTLSADSPRFSRLSYHGGTVWPHDTAIAVRGLAAEGHLDQAARLARGLFVAAEGVDYRLPELYGGDAADHVPLPSAYPAACRPQAWSAAAPLAALVAVSGLRAEGGRLAHPERTSDVLGGFALRGLRVAGRRLDVHVDRAGAVSVEVGDGDAPPRIIAE